jgi:tetratricopeptide (TPR) repeat protein
MKYLASHQYEKAEQYFANTIAMINNQAPRTERASGLLSRQLAYAYGNLGQAQKERGRYSDAAKSYSKAIDLLDEGVSGTHP